MVIFLLFVLWFGTLLNFVPAKARLYYKGVGRLRAGFCPACNSSPPRPDCPVCEGDNDYYTGVKNNPEKRREWLKRWNKMMEVLK